MTLVILGLDALDAAQVEHFDVDEFRLNTYGEMETFAHQNPIPHTGEVWPSVATGLHPDEHGITYGGESEWDSPIVEYASRFVAPYLSMPLRAKLGRLVQGATGADWQIHETDSPTIFDGDGRYVHNWPGVHRSEELQRVWDQIEKTVEGSLPEEAFDRELCANEVQKFAWVKESLNFNTVLIATHIHLLDAAGHAYGRNENHYRFYYEKTADHIREIRNKMDDDDELLILSDHGMNTGWLPNDHEICHHSFRAFSASTLDSHPESVFEVRDWVKEHVGPHERRYDRRRERTDLEMPEETLRDLGYID